MFNWLKSLFAFDDSDRDEGLDPYDYYTYSYLTDSDPLNVITDNEDDEDAIDDGFYGGDYDYDYDYDVFDDCD